MRNIAAIVVTYNRKKLLCQCLRAIEKQEFRPTVVYVIDNASTDGTSDLLREMEFSINVEYIYLSQNLGGAGGFYEGLKLAFEKNEHDAFWMMDDDGIPEQSCLSVLADYLGDYAYVAPLVLSIENREELAFPYLKEKTHKEVLIKYGSVGLIKNYANPFNGILYRKDLVNVIGFPKKEMFIWGDECEYNARALKFGYFPVTVINAVHYHPKDRISFFKDFRGIPQIIYVESNLRRYCKYRNMAYCLKKYGTIKEIIYFLFSYFFFFLISRKLDIKGLSFFIRAIFDGTFNVFGKHFKYIK